MICKHCQKDLPLSEFPTRTDHGKLSHRKNCRTCETQLRLSRAPATLSEDAKERKRIKANHRAKNERKMRHLAPKFIVQDARKADKKAGRENDLDIDFVRDCIKDGCFYCGNVGARMTLDRIDNEKGHTKNNVKPACARCNMLRGDMPYEAWIAFAMDGLTIREVRERGLIDNWHGGGNTSHDVVVPLVGVSVKVSAGCIVAKVEAPGGGYEPPCRRWASVLA